jgi:hypothetical protein
VRILSEVVISLSDLKLLRFKSQALNRKHLCCHPSTCSSTLELILQQLYNKIRFNQRLLALVHVGFYRKGTGLHPVLLQLFTQTRRFYGYPYVMFTSFYNSYINFTQMFLTFRGCYRHHEFTCHFPCVYRFYTPLRHVKWCKA